MEFKEFLILSENLNSQGIEIDRPRNRKDFDEILAKVNDVKVALNELDMALQNYTFTHEFDNKGSKAINDFKQDVSTFVASSYRNIFGKRLSNVFKSI